MVYYTRKTLLKNGFISLLDYALHLRLFSNVFELDLMFIICWLLHPDPRWRATMSDLEENNWINQPVDITKYSFDAVLG